MLYYIHFTNLNVVSKLNKLIESTDSNTDRYILKMN